MRRISGFLWGDLKADELKKFGSFALTLLFIIGAYWLLRPLRDGIFASMVGVKYQPAAKMVSLAVLVPITIYYGKLANRFDQQRLFYVVTAFYIVSFSIIGLLLALPQIGLSNTHESPERVLGWITYAIIESFGSLMVPMFWSLVASSTDPHTARRGFPLIIFGAQIGSILGPTMATHAEFFGLPILMGLSILPMLCTIAAVATFKHHHTLHDPSDHPQTGPLEGLKLVFTKYYVFGIFVVSTFFDITYTILDFQMQVTAREIYTTPESFTQFMGFCGQSINAVSFFVSLFLTSILIRRLGVTISLLIFPLTVASLICAVYLNPGLWTLFVSVVVLKGLNYALNNPTKEILYIPTTRDIRVKAKSWIDAFGTRSAKATGAVINNLYRDSLTSLLAYGSLFALAFTGVWIAAAALVGQKFSRMTGEKPIELDLSLDEPILEDAVDPA